MRANSEASDAGANGRTVERLDERTARLEAQVAELSKKLDAAIALSGLKEAAGQLVGKEKEERPQSFWNSPAGVALISLLGGVLILVWNAVSYHFDSEAEGRRQLFDRRTAAKRSLDDTFGVYSGHAATICLATVRMEYLKLWQQYLLSPRGARLKTKANDERKAACDAELALVTSRVEEDLKRTQERRQKAFEYLATVKEIEQPLTDVEAVFATAATKQSASQFAEAWNPFRELLRGDIQGEWKDALRAEAQRQGALEAQATELPPSCAHTSGDEALEKVLRTLSGECRARYQSIVEAYGRLGKEMSNEIANVYD
ncbi:MAG: hypothetical protein DIU78_017335 [Pseudomonadota bacterium]